MVPITESWGYPEGSDQGGCDCPGRIQLSRDSGRRGSQGFVTSRGESRRRPMFAVSLSSSQLECAPGYGPVRGGVVPSLLLQRPCPSLVVSL